jgi:hypothetical protein
MSDIVFDNTEKLTALCDTLLVQGHDLLLDSPTRRKTGTSGFRRALVHDQNDGLTINFNGDYPGGVNIHGVTMLDVVGDLRLKIKAVVGGQTTVGHHTINLGHIGTETVVLSDVIFELRKEIADLKAQVATLAAKG